MHKKLAGSATKGDVYETQLIDQFSDTDATKEFFACLDMQLNKVNQFYRTKENEFMERADSLKKQMEFLISIKQSRESRGGTSSDEDVSVSSTISSSGI